MSVNPWAALVRSGVPLPGTMPFDRGAAARPVGVPARTRTRTGSMLVPHAEQFAGRWNQGLGVYYSRADEALRHNWQNALAMRRDAFIHDLLRHRQLPVVSLPWRIEVDDPKHPDQARAAQRLTQLVAAVPRFAQLRLYLAEDKWYGRYGAQLSWGRKRIDGRPGWTVTHHEPVDGDSLVWKFDGTPGVLVQRGWTATSARDQEFVEPYQGWWLQPTDRASALFLYDQGWRDHFIITQFEPSSADFLFEGDKAGAVEGVGLRSRVYWDYRHRMELMSWRDDSLQRIGVNGMLYAHYESGNDVQRDAVIAALVLMLRENVTALPCVPGREAPKIEHIEPAQVGYDVLNQAIDHKEEIIRRAFLGQTLSGGTAGTGMGSGVADLHEQMFQHIVRFDAVNQAEVLTRELLGPLVRRNVWEVGSRQVKGSLPFEVRFVYQIDKADVQERVQVVRAAYEMGLPLDSEKVYEDLGLSPPRDPQHVLVKPEAAAPAPGQPGQPPAPDGRPRPGGAPAPKRTSVAPGSDLETPRVNVVRRAFAARKD